MSVIWSGVTEEGAVVPVQVTAEGKVVAVGDGPQGDYLPITGGNLTGDLTIADKIALATNGDATFSGTVVQGNASGNNNFTVTNGLTYLKREASPTNPLLQMGNASTTYGKISISAAASFTEVNVGTQGTWDKIALNENGSAKFADDVIIGPNQSGSISNNQDGVQLKDYGFGLFLHSDSNNSAFINCSQTGQRSDLFAVSGDGSVIGEGTATFAGGKCGFTSAGELFFTSRNERYKLVVSNGICQAEPYTRQMELKEKAEQFIADKRETKPSGPSGPQSEVTPDNDNA